MNTFVLTFLVMALVMLLMASGVLITGRRLRGSCGRKEDCTCSLPESLACAVRKGGVTPGDHDESGRE